MLVLWLLAPVLASPASMCDLATISDGVLASSCTIVEPGNCSCSAVQAELQAAKAEISELSLRLLQMESVASPLPYNWEERFYVHSAGELSSVIRTEVRSSFQLLAISSESARTLTVRVGASHPSAGRLCLPRMRLLQQREWWLRLHLLGARSWVVEHHSPRRR